MKVTCEINDYSNPRKPQIRVHNSWREGGMVDLEVDGVRYTVDAEELISAIERAKLNVFGK